MTTTANPAVDARSPGVQKADAPRPVARHYLPGGRANLGGMGRFVIYVAEAAADDGLEHRVSDTRGPRFSPLSSSWHLLASLARMTRERVTAPACIHHLHVAGRGSTARKVILSAWARALGCIHVVHLHDYDYEADFLRRPRWQRGLVCRMFRGADHVIVLGRADRALARSRLGVPRSRLSILRNCVPDPGPRTEGRGPVPLIVFLGQLGERKGVPELLAALASPDMAAHSWRAVLAGDGPVEAYLAEARRLGIAERISMPGWIETTEARRLCAAADILALPSHHEGMALAVLEGMAHGMAVVTTRVGAHEEALDDGISGLFVPVGDPTALATVLSRLLADPAERERLGAAARARFLEEFDMKSYVQTLGHLYASLGSNPPSGGSASLETTATRQMTGNAT